MAEKEIRDSFGKHMMKAALPFYIGQTGDVYDRIGIQHCRQGQNDNIFENLAERRNYYHPRGTTFTKKEKLRKKIDTIRSNSVSISVNFEDVKKMVESGEDQRKIKSYLKSWTADELKKLIRQVDEGKELCGPDTRQLIETIAEKVAELNTLVINVLSGVINKAQTDNIDKLMSELVIYVRECEENFCAKPPYVPMREINKFKRGYWTCLDLKNLIDKGKLLTEKYANKVDQYKNLLGYKHFLDDFENFAIDRVNKIRTDKNRELLLNKEKSSLTWDFKEWIDQSNDAEKDEYEDIFLSWLRILLNGNLMNCDEIMKVTPSFCESKSKYWVYAFWAEERKDTEKKKEPEMRTSPYNLKFTIDKTRIIVERKGREFSIISR